MERDLIRTRTAEGRSRAKARGQHIGRPPALTPQQLAEARQRRADGATLKELAKSYNVGLATISRLDAERNMTAEEFLEWEERQEFRHEFGGFRPVAMTGARETHEDILANLITALRARLRGRDGRAYGATMKVSVAGSYRYPDAVIVCGPRDARRTVAVDPVVLFEIISESTQATDRVTKTFKYRSTPSIQRYLVLEQMAIGATVFTRDGEGWAGRAQGAGSTLRLPEAGIDLPLDELYEGLDPNEVSGDRT